MELGEVTVPQPMSTISGSRKNKSTHLYIFYCCQNARIVKHAYTVVVLYVCSAIAVPFYCSCIYTVLIGYGVYYSMVH